MQTLILAIHSYVYFWPSTYLYPLVSQETRQGGELALPKALKRQCREQQTDVEAFIEGAIQGKIEIVQWGIKRGVDIDAIGSRNQTALMSVASYGLLKIAQVLISAGADPNIQSDEEGHSDGTTALMKVANSYTCYFAENAAAFIKLLVAAGADANLQDQAGRTALIHALTWSYPGVSLAAVQALIDVGANLDIRDNNGLTALTYAQVGCKLHPHFPKVVNQLKAAGASE